MWGFTQSFNVPAPQLPLQAAYQKLQTGTQAQASCNVGSSSSEVEEAREKGIESEFQPDGKIDVGVTCVSKKLNKKARQDVGVTCEPPINSNGTLRKVSPRDMSYHALIAYTTPNI